MSEKPSEYLKRTCLICGCHTNQTINIYEPRSGPNIVQLIQAKFKFQPLNEDKYLCFSCNNWLINWHSLQALNSNDAESPSGTFRSHMNSMVSEKGAGSQQHHQHLQHQQQPRPCRPVAHVRPRQLETEATPASPPSATVVLPAPAPSPAPAAVVAPLGAMVRPLPPARAPATAVAAASPKAAKGLNFYAKRSFRPSLSRQSRRHRLKSMQTCCVCGRSIVIRVAGSRLGGVAMAVTSVAATTTPMAMAKSTTAKCRKCREVCKWRSIYLSSLARAERRGRRARPQPSVQQQLQQNQQQQQQPHQILVNANEANEANEAPIPGHSQSQSHSQSQIQSTNFRHLRPRVDGKVVSMLRRLGTTLSREAPQTQPQQPQPHSTTSTTSTTTSTATTTTSTKLPPIMSPAKQRPRWTRPLEDDEILLDFDTAISEVLPIVAAQQRRNSQSDCSSSNNNGRKQTRRKLTYHMTVDDDVETDVIDLSEGSSDDEVEDDSMEEGESESEREEKESSRTQWNPLESIYSIIPKGLSVSLI